MLMEFSTDICECFLKLINTKTQIRGSCEMHIFQRNLLEISISRKKSNLKVIHILCNVIQVTETAECLLLRY